MPFLSSKSLLPLTAYVASALVALTSLVGLRAAEVRPPHRQVLQPDEKEMARTPPIPEASWRGLIKKAVMQWVGHKDPRLGAALAYYSIFSIGPLIVIAIAIAGLLFGAEAVRNEVTGGLRGLLGDTGTQAIDAMLRGASKPKEGILATIIGVGTLIFAAIGVVVQLKDALNTVWEVDPPPGKGVWGFTRTYVLSFAGVLSLGFLLLISMLVTTALSAAGKFVAPYLPEVLMQVASFIVSFGVISLLFAMMFKWLPDANIHWRDVWIGSIATAALFEIGKLLIGLYIGKQGLESTYGAAASIVVVLVWVYYSAQIVLLGAEFTNIYAKHHGSLKGSHMARSASAMDADAPRPVAKFD